MKFFLSILICFSFFLSPAYAVSIDILSKTPVFLSQQTQLTQNKDGKLVDVFYRIPNTEKIEPWLITQYGTGFLIKYHDRDYLVTAKHVAKFLSSNGNVTLNLPNNKSINISFLWLSQQELIKGAQWFYHPKADVALYPMVFQGAVDQLSIDTQDEILFPKKDFEVELLKSAYIVGFPMGYGVQERLSPIAKEAKIASRVISINDPNVSPDLRFILLDQALAQGYSGSPVFYIEDIMSGSIKVEEKLHLIGIVSEASSDQTGGKISLIVPTSYIWDILESPDFISYEKGLNLKK